MNKIKKILLATFTSILAVTSVFATTSCEQLQGVIPGLGGHTHALTKVEKVDATCTTAGQEAYYTCNGCEEIFADANAKIVLDAPKEIAALGHKITGVAGSEASCTEDGVADVYKCTRCNILFNDKEGKNEIEKAPVIEALGHTLVKTEAKEVTCTEDGNHAYWTCSTCTKVYEDAEAKTETTVAAQTIKSEGHSLTMTEEKTATCTEGGNIAYWTCGACDKVYADEACEKEITLAETVVAAKGHSYEETLVVEGAVTEYEPGEAFNTANLVVKLDCTVCDYMETVTDYEISKTQNLQPEDSEIVLSCVKDGKTYTATVTIVVLHVHSTGDLIPAQEATCTEEGTIAYYECTACKMKFEDKEATKVLENIVVPANGHEGVMMEASESSCKEAGNNAYWTCEDCGKVFADADCTQETTVEEQKLPLADHETEIAKDDEGHWEECKNCDYASEKEAHVGVAYPDAAAVCDVCNVTFGEASWDGWVHFAPGVVYADYYEGIEGTVNGADYIDYELITLENGMAATKFSVKAGTPANASTAVWNDQNLTQNIKVPVRKNGTKAIAYITNHGTQDITVTFGAVNSAKDTGSGTVLVPAGKTAVAKFTVTSGAAQGNNSWFAVRDAVVSDTSFTVYGYFNVEDDIASLGIVKPAVKMNYQVGETFSAEGLRLSVASMKEGATANYGETEIYNNIVTNFDGYTFTNEDVGMQTVTVSFAGATVTYEITVAGHEHNMVAVDYQAATCTEDGVIAHYKCDLDNCGQLFADSEGTQPITADSIVIAKGHNFAEYPDTIAKCANCDATKSIPAVDGLVHFAPGVVYADYYEAISGTVNGADYINYELITLENGLAATKFTVAAGTPANASTAVWNDQDLTQNIKIPVRNDGTKAIVYITNHGLQNITVTLGAVTNKVDMGSGTVLVPAGRTASVEFMVTGGAAEGNNIWFAVRDAVASETSFTVLGYFDVGEDIASLSIKTPANKTSFKPGETFSAEGLCLTVASKAEDAQANYSQTEIYSNFATDLDGKVFTAADSGKKTVTVTFAGATVSYEIEVLDHDHEPVEVEGKAMIQCQENGYETYYRCTVVGCNKLFSDMDCTDEIKAPVVIPAHTASATLPGEEIVCAVCQKTYGETLSKDGWVHFAPGVVYADYYEAIEGTVNGADYINYELITLENGMAATKFTVAAGTPANASTAVWNDQNLTQNIKVPVRKNGTKVVMSITNHGTQNVTITIGAVNSATDTGSGTVLVPAGKTAAVAFTITAGAATGNNVWFAVRDAVESETSFTVYGYFNVEDDVEGLEIKTAANKTSFKVGEAFSAEGLRLAISATTEGSTANYSQTDIYSNFATDFDGKVFTAEDVGEHTVKVSFAGVTVEYTITVTAE